MTKQSQPGKRQRRKARAQAQAEERARKPRRRPKDFSPARHADLERAICLDFDDLPAWQVYGDWLLAQGDPFGELLSYELALQSAGPSARRRIDKLRTDLLLENIDIFGHWYLGEDEILSTFGEGVEVDFRLGFLEGLEIRGWPGNRPSRKDPLWTILPSSSARFLRSLGLHSCDWSALIEALPTFGARSTLRTLTLQDELGFCLAYNNRPADIAPRRVLQLEPVLAFAPELRELVLQIEHINFGASLACPRLVSLKLWSSYLRAGRGSSPDPLDVYARLFAGECLPALERLELGLWHHLLELIDLLARSPLLTRLRELELSFVGTDRERFDQVGRALLAHAHCFERLEALRIHGAGLSPSLTRELAEALPNSEVFPYAPAHLVGEDTWP